MQLRRVAMFLKESNPFRKWTITLTLSFISVLLSCGLIHHKKVFKYFQLEQLPVIKDFVYSDKKAVNNLIIEMKHGSINIRCIPFTLQEYEQYLVQTLGADEVIEPHETIELEISGRKLIATKNVYQNGCVIRCDDHYEGIGFFLLYAGESDISMGLRPVLASIKYDFSKETAKIARRNFLNIMNSIENMKIPVYGKASGVQDEYRLVGLARRIIYHIEIDSHSLEAFNFYQQFFAAHSWKPYDYGTGKDWFANRFFYSWIDGTGEILATLIISPEPSTTTKNSKLARQTVMIDLVPCRVMQWGEREVRR
jgi:hypothetical protein